MKKVFEEVTKIIVGEGTPTFLTIICVLARGHLLIEDVPGVGKTLLASTLARSCNIDFARVQCTPDVLPGDILGFSMYDVNTGNTKYIEGPVMTNLLLVDEINRASPKTQSALLEVMEEYKITVDSNMMKVPQPFMVIATQNPIENVGTSPLPEAQLDRFTMRISMGYPTFDDELLLLSRFRTSEKLPSVNSVLTGEEILTLQKEVSEIEVNVSVMKYIINIIKNTRNHPKIALGCSPRASLALMRCAQAKAYMHGRDYVVPDDVDFLAPHVLAHRLILTNKLHGLTSAKYSKEIINEIVQNQHA